MADSLKIILLTAAIGAAAWMIHRRQSDGESDQSPDAMDWVNQGTDTAQALFDDTDDMTAQTNLAAFLQAIRVGEGTASSDGFLILVGGARFSSFADHPAKLGWGGLPLSNAQCAGAGFGPGCVSTAAGAYQITKPTWNRLADKLGLTDFSPASQDAAAIQLITEKGALSDVKAGRIVQAVGKVSKVWASLPGAGYGQREVSQQAFNSHYQNYGGSLA